MRAMWSGAINVGLVAAPVKMYLGHDDHNGGLRLACKEHGQPIIAPRCCPIDGKKLEGHEIVKVAQINGETVPIEAHELDALPLDNLHLIAIDRFVARNDVPLATYAKGLYYLAPDKGGEKACALLRAAMVKTNTVGIARVGMREREQLVALGVGPAPSHPLILTQLAWPADVRDPNLLPRTEANFGERELNLALMLVEGMTGTWSPQEYVDRHREAMDQLIALKAKGMVPIAPKKPQRGAEDLLEALQASVKAQAQARPKKAPVAKPKPKVAKRPARVA